MSDKKSKMGRPPLPDEDRKKILRAVRITEQQSEDLARVSRELRLSVPDLMRMGTIYLLRDIESENFDLDRLYRDAATT